MKFRGVIFDLDGTLVNSLEDLADSMNTVLQSWSYPTHGTEIYKNLIGNGLQNLVRKALPETVKDEEVIMKCFGSMIEEYRNDCINKTKPYDGIIDLLDKLVSYNMKLSVFSNKADELTKRIVSSLLPNYFEAIVGLSNEAYRKPNPAGALQISKLLDINPVDMVYVGDTGIDMQTANNASMCAVGALWGFREKDELISNGARYLLSKPSDLIRILQQK